MRPPSKGQGKRLRTSFSSTSTLELGAAPEEDDRGALAEMESLRAAELELEAEEELYDSGRAELRAAVDRLRRVWSVPSTATREEKLRARRIALERWNEEDTRRRKENQRRKKEDEMMMEERDRRLKEYVRIAQEADRRVKEEERRAEEDHRRRMEDMQREAEEWTRREEDETRRQELRKWAEEDLARELERMPAEEEEKQQEEEAEEERRKTQ